MKLKTEIFYMLTTAAVFGSIALFATNRSRATQPPQPRGCVILQSMQTIQNLDSTNFVYAGMVVYSSSSSPGAPTFEPPVFDHAGNSSPAVPLAEAIAQCLEAGFHIERSDANGLILIK